MWWDYTHKYIHIHVFMTVVCEGEIYYLGRRIAECKKKNNGNLWVMCSLSVFLQVNIY